MKQRSLNNIAYLLLLLTSLSAQSGIEQKTDMTTATHTPLKTHCIGRLLVDLPIEGEVSRSQSFEWIDDFSRLANISSQPEFWSLVEARRDSLSQQPHESEGHLLSAFKKGDGWALMLFRPASYTTAGYKVERYLWLGDSGFALRKSGDAISSNDAINHLNDSKYTAIFNNIRPRPNNEIPSMPGFCVDGAMLVGEMPARTTHCGKRRR